MHLEEVAGTAGDALSLECCLDSCASRHGGL
jgi:hypothetical protein